MSVEHLDIWRARYAATEGNSLTDTYGAGFGRAVVFRGGGSASVRGGPTVFYASSAQGNLFHASTKSPEIGIAMTDPTREEISAQIAASEARGDTKIARIEGKLDLVISKIDGFRDDNRATRANQWVIGLGLAALIVGLVAIVPIFFSVGTQIRDMVHEEARLQASQPQAHPSVLP